MTKCVRIQFFALTLILFFFFFNIKFKLFNFSTFYFSVAVVIILGLINIIFIGRISKYVLLITFPLIITFIFSLISLLINSPDVDFFFTGAVFILTAIVFFSFSFLNFFSNLNPQGVVASAVFALTFNAILIIIMFVSRDFQSFYINLLSTNSFDSFGGLDQALDSMYRYRMIGSTGFASYSIGFTQVIGLYLLATYYWLSNKKIDIIFLAISSILITSAALSSRSSILGVLLWVIFCLFFFGLRFFINFLLSLLTVGLLLATFIVLIDSDGASFFIGWALDLFSNGTESASLAETLKMISEANFFDAGFFGFSRWYGDFSYNYFRSIDIGFIRIVLAGGFGSIFWLLIHFVILGIGILYAGRSLFLFILYIFLMIFFSLIMLKGAILFDFFAFDFVMVMLFWVSLKRKEYLGPV